MEQGTLSFWRQVTSALIGLAPGAEVVWAADGTVRAVNAAAVQLLGYSAEGIAGRSRRTLVDEEQSLMDVLGAGLSDYRYEASWRRSDGRLVDLIAHAAPISSDGRLRGWVERIEPREAVAATPEVPPVQWVALIDSLGDAVISQSPSGEIWSWNEAAERLYGYSAAEMIGRSIDRLVPAERLKERAEMIEHVRVFGRLTNYKTVRMHKDGRQMAVFLTMAAVRDDAGQMIGISSVVHSATARLADCAACRVESQLQLIIDSVPVMVFALDNNGVLTLVEGRTFDRLGLHREHLLGRNLLSSDDPATLWLSRSIGQVLEGESCDYTASVGARFVEVCWIPQRDADNQIRGANGVAVDVTEEHRAQEEIFRASKLESIGILAGGIAHDFNNILSAIVGNLALARMALEPGTPASSYVSESETAALRARSLTQQLLTFAKGGKPVKKPINLAPLVDSAVHFALRGSNCKPQVLAAPDLWLVEGDEGQLTQVINNLVINAQQSMATGGMLQVQVSNVHLSRREGALSPGSYVRIEFQDHGCGIGVDDIDKVFDPFFTTKAQGSGLGLTTSYRIVSEHHGRIEMHSQIDCGTRVRVYLPRAPVNEGSEPEADRQTAKGRVLFMDDDEAIRRVAGNLLRLLGYEVVLAENGTEAIRLYEDARKGGRRRFDLVILDLTVPGGLGGLETLAGLKALDPEVIAVVSSGYSSDPVLADHVRFGFAGKVPKPYTPETLVATLDPLIEGARNRPLASRV